MLSVKLAAMILVGLLCYVDI